VQPAIELDGDAVRFALRSDSVIFDEIDGFTWLASMPGDADRAMLAIAQGFDRRAIVQPVDALEGERRAYRLSIDESASPAVPQREVSLAKISTGAFFEFEQRRPLRM
jgi:hypothetical protein